MALTDDIVSYWDLTEQSGPREDSHGSNDLTDNNTVGYSVEAWGNAADLEFSNSEYFSIAHASQSADLVPGTSDFSFSIWFRPESQPSSYPARYDFAAFGSSIMLHWRDPDASVGDKLCFTFDRGGAWSKAISADQSFSNGSLYHIVYVWIAASHTIEWYVNGSSIGTSTAATGTPVDYGDDFYIGRFSYGGYVDGVLAAGGWWKRALTSTEVTALYNSGTPLLYAGLSPAVGPVIPAFMNQYRQRVS